MKARQLLRRSAAVSVLLLNAVVASAVTFTADTYISATNFSTDGQDVVVSNCTLTVDGPHGFNSIQIQNGGVLTHSAFTNGPEQATYSVIDETQTLSVSNPATFLNTNVDATSIVVMDISGSITYTDNVDYVVISSPPYTELELTTNSAIAEGTNVLVSYHWLETYQGFSLVISNDVQVLAGGAVNLDGKGYAGGQGFGNGAGTSRSTNYPYAFSAGGGGGHGGCGGMSSTFAPGGGGYDSTTQPAILGSSGGIGTSLGGAGGGAGQLLVGGILQVDGEIAADGSNGTNSHSGGGAGGGLLLSAQTFAGAGTISASGGAGDSPDGGGGGGGSIAIYFATNNFTGTISAFGGAGFKYGGAGTVFFQPSNSLVGQLLIANNGIPGTNTLFLPGGAGALTISGGAIAQSPNASFAVSNLFIGSNSSLVPSPLFPLVVTVNGDATIQSSGVINASFASPSGSGAGGVSCNVGTGGGYGGYGGTSSSCGRSGGIVYGSIGQPTSFGSPGGGQGSMSPGGGAINVTVAGTLSLAGKITADGAPARSGSANGGGSGGGIWLKAGTFAGNGLISAIGGTADPFVGGGGGGGRIAVSFNTNQFTGSILAHGGAGAGVGGPGTVYVMTNGSPFGQLTIDNAGLPGFTALLSPLVSLDLTISGDAIVTNFGGETDSLRNLLIAPNSFFTISRSATAIIAINATNVTIQPGGGIVTDGASTSQNGGGLTVNSTGGGGGNGGMGGMSASNAPGGLGEGSIAAPTTPGGIGGNGVNGLGGNGGDAVSLTAGSLQLDGTITANGVTSSVLNSGGGAGGSINLTVGSLSGAGTISANGGNGNNGIGGGGGGGRLAVRWSVTNGFSGVMVAHGGIGGIAGGAGTVYTVDNLGHTQLLVDNANMPGAKTPFPQGLTGTLNLFTITGGAWVTNTAALNEFAFGNLFVGSNGTFQAGYSSLLTLTVSSNAIIQSGGLLTFDGGNATGVSGNGQTLNSTGGGGSYGGIGGTSLSNAAGGPAIFDTFTSPESNGGRGGAGFNGGAGGNGGGSWSISVNGTLQLDGKISAEGVTGSGLNSGGGAGGSIQLSVGTLAGSGRLSVNGGAANGPAGGGGGGGRIALYFSSDLFAGSLTAFGGAGGNVGGAGTVYTAAHGISLGQLTINNAGFPGLTMLPTALSSLDLTISGGATVANYDSSTAALRNLFIGSNSSFTVSSNTQLTRLTITATNVTIQPGGGIIVDGTSSAPIGLTLNGTGGGGANVGDGGASASNAPGEIPNGDNSDITTGGSGFNEGPGGKGGGVVNLTVTGALQLDGSISANGLAGPSLYSGGGAGGTISLAVGSLSGAGVLSANGGAGNSMIGGGGGGGLLSIHYATNQFSGSTLARGGPGANAGGAGIIYWAGNPNQQIILDNGGLLGGITPAFYYSFPQSVFDLSVTGGAILSNRAFTVGNLLIGSNSAILEGSPQQLQQINFTVLSNATIQASGSLASDGVNIGSIAQQGQFVNSTGGGGTYGGVGGTSVSNALGGAPVFDSVTQPGSQSLGGRGGSGANQALGGNAGGSMRVTVDGILQLDGRISAQGVTGPGLNSGGGAGGAIWLSAGRLSGAGTLSVNGGAANGLGGGGGGGHIAMYYNSNSFAGAVTAYGGAGANYGGAGTIYVNSGFTGQGQFSQLTVDNGGQSGNTFLSTYPAGNFTITGSAMVKNTNSTAGPTFQNLLINSNSTFLYYSSTEQIITVLTNATIQMGSKLIADGTSTSIGGQSLNFTGGGGGHGGYGGASLSNALGGNVLQDSISSPSLPGTRGGAGASQVPGGNGGGTLGLFVKGTLQLDGKLSADGLTSAALNGGGGSGGAVLLEAGTLSGAGTISANGGAGDNVGGGGGGGRIAVSYVTNSFAGTITARGGSGAHYGGAGTIVTGIFNAALAFPDFPQLIVDNGGNRGSNTLISGAPASADVFVNSGAAVTLPAGSTTWKSLTIASNGTLGATFGSAASIALSITSDLAIQPGGAITFDGDGFGGDVGPGRGIFIPSGGGGGGHGGDGSAGSPIGASGGSSYDSITAPTQAGSGGGGVSFTPGSAGGGALQLNVTGTLMVNGPITANGMPANTNGAGGGSGGSLFINAGTLGGSAKISVDGGNGDPLAAGGGGGGRIALYFNSDTFTGTLSARGGAGVGLSGGAGTIYIKTNSASLGQLIVDNAGLAGANTPLSSLSNLVALVLRNSAQADSINPLTLQSLSISSAAAFNADSLASLNLTVLGNALVDTNGAIVADGAGYSPADNGPGSGGVDGFGNGGGGGYGGAGGSSLYGGPGGGTYGSLDQPTDFGSAGGTSPTVTNFSQGAGTIRIVVNGKLTINGIISADGNNGVIAGAGGGSGGSIWITTSILSGKGLVTANGGAGESNDGGGGGGGRIVINPATNFFEGYAVAFGGDGATPGDDGTVLIAPTFVISGTVFDTNGAPVAGVTLQPSGLASVKSDAAGFYSVTVPPIWSGSVTPTDNAFFLPSSLSYSTVSANATNQNFLVALPSSFNFTGTEFDGTNNAGFSWYGINGVSYQPLCSSNLVDWTPYGSPILGTNGPAMFQVPVTNAPQLFFRLSVAY